MQKSIRSQHPLIRYHMDGENHEINKTMHSFTHTVGSVLEGQGTLKEV